MFMECRMPAAEGVFHARPDDAHWYGWAKVAEDASRLRKDGKQARIRPGCGGNRPGRRGCGRSFSPRAGRRRRP